MAAPFKSEPYPQLRRANLSKAGVRFSNLTPVGSVGKRRRLAVFRTTNCREQLISAHGRLERVLKAANRLRFIAGVFHEQGCS